MLKEKETNDKETKHNTTDKERKHHDNDKQNTTTMTNNKQPPELENTNH